MTLQVNLVDLGLYPNDGTGDDLRSAFIKSNQNFQSIADNVVLDAANLGTGAGIFFNKSGNTLRFKSIKTGNTEVNDEPMLSVTNIDSESITLTVRRSINSLFEDPNPILAGTLNLNDFDIAGFGNIDISGDITADTITGNFIGNFSGNISGNIFGDLYGNVYGLDTNVQIMAVDTASGDYNTIFLNSLIVTGNSSVKPGTTLITTLEQDGISIFSDLDLVLSSNSSVIVDTNLVVTGTILGQINDISNHNLRDLGDVSNTIPTNGQALVWNGSVWTPGNVATTSNGITNYDFGILSGVRDPFDLIMQFTNVDFGSIYDSTSVKLDLGPIVEGTALYSLESSSLTVTEGNSFTISLTTVNVENNTLIPYTITGISSDDINSASLTGSFTVVNNFASIFFTVSVDELLETEIFTLTLDSVTPAVFVSVTLLDPGSEVPEYTGGNIDGGSPTTTLFTVVADGGSPTTTLFTVVADGGIAGVLDGGTPSTASFTGTIEGGDPSTIPTEIYDGGIVD
jgi:hypothetical protein